MYSRYLEIVIVLDIAILGDNEVKNKSNWKSELSQNQINTKLCAIL